MLDRRILEISSIVVIVWGTLLSMLLFIDVYIVTFRIPFTGYFWHVLTGILRTLISAGLFGAWLFLWKSIVKWYFKKTKFEVSHVEEVFEAVELD